MKRLAKEALEVYESIMPDKRLRKAFENLRPYSGRKLWWKWTEDDKYESANYAVDVINRSIDLIKAKEDKHDRYKEQTIDECKKRLKRAYKNMVE